MVGRDAFQRVRFVEDRDVVVGQNRRPFPPQREVREKQRMIDDQNVGIASPAAGFEVVAVVVRRTGPPQAVAMLALDFIPDTGSGTKAERSPAAIGRLLRPGDHLFEVEMLGLGGEHRGSPIGRPLETPEADVVAPPLHQDRAELDRQHRVEKRDVLVDQLFLEGDRMRRDDDAGPFAVALVVVIEVPAVLAGAGGFGVVLRLRGREDRGDEISKTLADAGSRLGEEMPPLGNGLRDGFGQFELLGPVLVGLESLCDLALRPQD